VQLFFTELENRTVLTLLAKPVTRTEFVLGKFLGASGVTVVFCASQTLLLAAVLWSREVALMRQHPEVFAHGHVINYTWLAQCGGLLWLKLAVLGALTLLVVSYAGRALFAMVTGALIYLCGHLQSFALEAAARAGSAFTRTAAGIAGRILPDFQLFQMPEAGGGFPPGIAAYALGYIAAACTLAAFSFARREL
jgi:ABC-type transport system involved in multi-copper enzyme maturation permease subunit